MYKIVAACIVMAALVLCASGCRSTKGECSSCAAAAPHMAQ